MIDIKTEDVKNNILTILREIKRYGMDKLINYLETSDYFTAPASTRFHSNFEGGLALHSYNVLRCLLAKDNNEIWRDKLKDVPTDSKIITALLHDLCKTNFYATDFKNQKTYDPEKVAKAQGWQRKTDNAGTFIWETVPVYVVDDKIPYGHGEKSVMMIEEYIKLTQEERYAIRWHMGFSEPKENWNAIGQVFDKYPLALALHEADQESSHLLEETR